MIYIPWLIASIILLIIGIFILIYLSNKGYKGISKYIILIPGVLLVFVSGYFVWKSESLKIDNTISINDIQDTYTFDEDKANLVVNGPRNTQLRLTNDFLMMNTPDDIYNQYNQIGKKFFDDFFLTDTISKDFALTLVGKKVEGILDTTNDLVAHMNKGRYVVAILNQGEHSKKFVEKLNKTKFYDNVDYLAYFPMDDPDTVKKFYEETGLVTNFVPISLQPQFATEQLNVVGAPSVVSIESGVITLAINNYDLYEEFHEHAFLREPLYNQIEKNND